MLKLGSLQVDLDGDTSGLKAAEKELKKIVNNSEKELNKLEKAIDSALEKPNTSGLKAAEKELKKIVNNSEKELDKLEKAIDSALEKPNTSGLKAAEKEVKKAVAISRKELDFLRVDLNDALSKKPNTSGLKAAKEKIKKTVENSKIAFRRMSAALASALSKKPNTSGLKAAEKEIKKTASGTEKAFKRVGSALAAAFSIEASRRILMIADNVVLLKAKIDVATNSQKESNKTFKELVRISNLLGTSIGGTIQSFQRFALVKDSVNASNNQVILFTETLQKLGAVSGATGTEIVNTSIQISQALNNNFESAAQEINSINEQLPAVARAVERNLGLASGAFKKAFSSGERDAADFFKAIIEESKKVDEKFEKLPLTVKRASQAVANNFAIALNEIDEISGSTEGIAKSIKSIADLIASDMSSSVADVLEDFNLLGDQIGSISDSVFSSTTGIINADAASFAWGETLKDIINKFRFIKDAIIQLPINLKGLATIIFAEVDQGLTAITSSIESMSLKFQAFFKKPGSEAKKALLEQAELVEENAEKHIAISKTVVSGLLDDIRNEKEAFIAASEARIAQREKEKGSQAGITSPSGDASDVSNIKSSSGGSEVSDTDLKRLKNIRNLGETEREEIERIAKERLDFLKTQTQLEADEIESLQETINNKKIASLQEMNDRQKALQEGLVQSSLASTIQLGDQINQALENSGREGTAIAKAVFLAQKAIQVVSILAATEVAAANAAAVSALGGPVGFFGTQAAIRATGYASAALVGGMAIGETFEAGGIVGGSSFSGDKVLARVNSEEMILNKGQQSKLFNMANGGGGGGGGGNFDVSIISNGEPQIVTGTSTSEGKVAIMIDNAVRKINGSLASGHGDTFNSLKRGSKIERNLR